MADEKQNQFTMLALVGIVAVVGIVGLTMMVVGVKTTPVMAGLPASAYSSVNAAGQPYTADYNNQYEEQFDPAYYYERYLPQGASVDLLNCDWSGENALWDGYRNGLYDQYDVQRYIERCTPDNAGQTESALLPEIGYYTQPGTGYSNTDNNVVQTEPLLTDRGYYYQNE